MVEKMGHTVLLAENGKIAVDVLKESDVDLVLMDVQSAYENDNYS